MDIKRLQTSVSLYRIQEDTFPANLGLLVPAYIDELPTDPVMGSPYGYNVVTGLVSEGS